MPSVTFSFRAEVPEERRKDVLEQIGNWATVATVALLKPDARHEITRRMAFATLKDIHDAENIARKIAELPEIESASVPPARGLV